MGNLTKIYFMWYFALLFVSICSVYCRREEAEE